MEAGARPRARHRLRGGYACLFQLLLAALIGAALTADLFNLFVWSEVAALSSYGLTGFFLERPIALEAAFKILVLTTLASFSVFLGAGLLYAKHGALNYAQRHDALSGHVSTPDLVALGLLVGGFATKAGLVPLHGWLADAHTAAPGPVSALFSGLMVSLGIVGIARVTFGIYGPSAAPVPGLLLVIGLVSALRGSRCRSATSSPASSPRRPAAWPPRCCWPGRTCGSKSGRDPGAAGRAQRVGGRLRRLRGDGHAGGGGGAEPGRLAVPP